MSRNSIRCGREVVALQKQFDDAENTCTNISSFLKMAKRYADFDELTPAMLRDLIEKIIVHEGDKSSGHREQRIEIYYTFIGAAESSQINCKTQEKSSVTYKVHYAASLIS